MYIYVNVYMYVCICICICIHIYIYIYIYTDICYLSFPSVRGIYPTLEFSCPIYINCPRFVISRFISRPLIIKGPMHWDPAHALQRQARSPNKQCKQLLDFFPDPGALNSRMRTFPDTTKRWFHHGLARSSTYLDVL